MSLSILDKTAKRINVILQTLFATGLALLTSTAMAEYAWNMPEGVTEVSKRVYGLHNLIFWICVAIGIVVFGIMFYAIFKHRKSKGAKASQFHESTLVEIVWTVIPFLILVGMAIPATKTLVFMHDTEEPDMYVKVTGYQWKWRYEYINEDVSFFSNLSTPRDQIENKAAKGENYLLEVDNPLVIPINKKVGFLITANDVLHSWWVPDLGVKKDAIPGFINESWTKITTPGTYRGQCTELCGKDHGFMPVVIVAKAEADYEAWLAEQKAKKPEIDYNTARSMDWLMEKGEKVYNTACAACHQANGEGIAGAFPALKGSAMATEKDQINKHIDVIINGVSGTMMQAFKDQLNDEEIAAVVTYERNAWGNNTGEMVQAIDVKNARN